MLLISWRDIRRHPVRFLLSALAVVLGVAFITGTLALRTSLSSTFDGIVSGSYQADVYVQPVDSSASGTDVTSSVSSLGSSNGVPLSDADTIAGVEGVSSVSPTIQGTGVLIGRDGTPVTTSGAPTLMFADTGEMSTEFTLVSGRMPEKAGEIALESSALESTGFSVGDSTTIVIGGSVQPVTIVGDVSYSAAVFGTIIVVVDYQTGVDAFAPTGTVSSIGVYADSGVDSLTLAQDVASALGADVTALPSDKYGYEATTADGLFIQVRTGDSLRSDLADSINSIVGFISIFLLIFAAIALFVGGFIIANTFTMSVRQRMKEIAVLRAIGASPLQVFLQIVVQAAIIGVVGSVLGIGVGMGLVGIVRNVLESTGAQLTSGIPLTAQTVVVSIVAGLVVSIVSAALPAWRAATIPPVAAMRDTVTTESRLLVRGVIGAVVLLGGIALAVGGGARGSDGGPMLGWGAALVLLGAIAVAPVIVPSVIGVLAWPLAKLWKPIGALARGNVVRNPRRTASTAAALMIGMALVGACAVVASSAQASVSTLITVQAKADFLLMNASSEMEGVPSDAADAVEAVEGASRVDRFYFGTGALVGTSTGSVDAASAQATYFLAGTDGAFSESLSLPIASGDISTVDDGEAAVRQSFADQWDVGVGDTITLASSASSAGQDGASGSAAGGVSSSYTVTIGAILDDNSVVGSPLILPLSTYDALVPEGQRLIDMMAVTAAPGTTVADLHTELTDAVKQYYVVSVQDKTELVSSMSNQINQVLYILYALLGLSIIIAILGIVNTLALSVIERTREIGLTRAVGLGRLQLSATIVLESVYIAVFGALLGLAIGTGIASLLPSVLSSRGFDQLAIPWGELGWMLLLSAIVGVLAALWPASRAARMKILDSVASE